MPTVVFTPWRKWGCSLLPPLRSLTPTVFLKSCLGAGPCETEAGRSLWSVSWEPSLDCIVGSRPAKGHIVRPYLKSLRVLEPEMWELFSMMAGFTSVNFVPIFLKMNLKKCIVNYCTFYSTLPSWVLCSFYSYLSIYVCRAACFPQVLM